MNLHDWSRVEDGTFHDFHTGWTVHSKNALNKARLPEGYYAQSALAEAPPRVSVTRTIKPSALRRRRTLTIRHTSGHRIVALVEIVSQANKSSADAVAEFVSKVGGALRAGIHVVVID